MSDIAIRVENLSKLYRIGPRECYKALRDTPTDAVYAPFRGILWLVNPKSEFRNPKSDSYIWPSRMSPSRGEAGRGGRRNQPQRGRQGG